MRRVAVLGATGSIGRSTLDVIQRHPDRYQVTLLSAHRSVDDMEALCRTHQPSHAVMGDPDAAAALADRLADLSAVTVETSAKTCTRFVVPFFRHPSFRLMTLPHVKVFYSLSPPGRGTSYSTNLG